jgi:hypothetical protein
MTMKSDRGGSHSPVTVEKTKFQDLGHLKTSRERKSSL